MKTLRRSLLVLGLAAITAPAVAGFDLGGVISAGQDLAKAATLSDDDMRKMAAQSAQVMDRKNKVAPEGSPYAERLKNLTRGLDSVDGVKLNYKVYLVNDVNAFAMADGTIRVFAGLLDKMTDDEARYVIGHEIGHVKLGHSRKAFQTAYAASAARKAGAASGNATAAALSESALGDLAQKLVNAQFSQAQENDADSYSLKLLKARNYDAKAAVSALRKLEKMYGNNRSAFSSHPAPGERADRLSKLV